MRNGRKAAALLDSKSELAQAIFAAAQEFDEIKVAKNLQLLANFVANMTVSGVKFS